jgi:DNA-binding GntR family transcriptional regulator
MSYIARYRRIADLVTPLITHESLRRLDATLEELRAKALASSKDAQELNQHFHQGIIDKVNEILSVENAWRIRQWTQKILDEENALKAIQIAQAQEIAPLGFGEKSG